MKRVVKKIIQMKLFFRFKTVIAGLIKEKLKHSRRNEEFGESKD